MGIRGRWWLLLFLAFDAACGDTREAQPEPALVVLIPRDAEELDPRFVADPYGLKVSRLLFASLVRIDPQTLRAVPDLAERVVVEAPTRYRVELRDGLRFADGSALTSTDVAATFQSVVSPKLGSRYAETYRRITHVETPSDRVVIFHLDAPHAPFLTDLELPVLRELDASGPIARLGGPMPVGAGPYRMTERVPGRIELQANRFWHGGSVRLERLQLLVIRDDNTRALRMLAQEGDLAVNAIPPMLLPMFTSPFGVRTARGIGATYLGVRTDRGPLADVRVRRAVAHAIDRHALIRAKYAGHATPSSGWIPPGHWAYADDVTRYAFDPNRSRALLDDAGYVDPDGAGPRPRLRLAMRTSAERSRQSIARAVAAMLRDVGVEIDLRPSETATLVADMNRGRFELAMLQVPEVVEPHLLSWFFASDRIPTADRPFGANRWRYRSGALDEALERGRRTLDPSGRKAAYAEAQRILSADLPVIPLWHEDVVAVYARAVRSYRVPRDARFGTLIDVVFER